MTKNFFILQNLDLINKNLLLSTNTVILINKIVVTFSKENFNSSFSEKNPNLIKQKLFFSIYLFFNNFPLIKNESVSIKGKQNLNSENDVLQIMLTNKRSIFLFLRLIFFENALNVSFFNLNKNLFVKELKSKINLKIISDLSYIFFSPLISTDIKDIPIDLSLTFNKKSIKSVLQIKSFFPFWHKTIFI